MLLSASVNFHLIHSFSSVPVQEGFPPEHGRELLAHSPVQKSNYQQKLRPWKGLSARDVTHTGLDIVGDPLNESRKSSCSAHSLSVRPLPLCSSFP